MVSARATALADHRSCVDFDPSREATKVQREQVNGSSRCAPNTTAWHDIKKKFGMFCGCLEGAICHIMILRLGLKKTAKQTEFPVHEQS
jgi:hypothetical protein